jgi:hypothetical protein
LVDNDPEFGRESGEERTILWLKSTTFGLESGSRHYQNLVHVETMVWLCVNHKLIIFTTKHYLNLQGVELTENGLSKACMHTINSVSSAKQEGPGNM